MYKKYLILFIVSLSFSNLYAINEAYLKTKVKNRAAMQKESGAFKHQKYEYVSERDIKDARNSNNPNLGVISVNRGDNIREAHVYIESDSKININNRKINKNSKKNTAQVGVINVGKHANLKEASITVKARQGIDITQRAINSNSKSQVGVVNMKRSSSVKNIRTTVDTNKKINIKNY